MVNPDTRITTGNLRYAVCFIICRVSLIAVFFAVLIIGGRWCRFGNHPETAKKIGNPE
jgi:hypothetical protein